MKLLELNLWGYKNLEDITIDFEKSDGYTLIVGTNGSGKSNLLEAISAIFSALYSRDKNISPNFRFELRYALNDSCFVFVRNADGVIELSYSETLDVDVTDCKAVDSKDYDKYLPDHLIAVYSGEEQRLWEEYYKSAYEEYNKQYMDGRSAFRPQQMIYLNHYYWDLIASILSIHDIEDYRNFISNDIGIKDISSIRMEFDVDKLKKNRNERAKHILEIINPEKKASVDVSLETLGRVKEYCGYEPDMLYNMVVLRLYKEYKIITNLTIKCANDIEIKDLSEGEKKLLLIYGAINLLSGNNLYLLDEPDAHLHEGRKKEIFDLIRQDEHSQFIITSHSPTLTTMFNADEVVLLDKTEGNCSVHYGEVAKTISKLTDGEWNYINQALFYDSARPLILLEGPGDVKYIRKAVDLLSEDEPNYNILKSSDILHCGGASNIQRTIDELKGIIPTGKTVIALYDRDEEGGKHLKAAIGKGKDRTDTNTYKHDSIYYLKLPKTPRYGANEFVIEDYFSKQTKKAVAQSFIDNTDDGFNSIPKDLRQKVKDKLYADLDTYDKTIMNGFKVLLDKLCMIVNGLEATVEV